jgi:membrane-associated phospholipid phosphatase
MVTSTAGATEHGIRAPSPQGLLRLAALFALLAVLALTVDIQVAAACRERCIGGDIGKLVSLAEVFAHGMGVAMILLAVVVLDPFRRRHLLRLALLSLGAGLVCDVVKVLVPRARPDYGEPLDSALASFLGWEALADSQGLSRLLEHGLQSFPSGHTTVAVGLAIGLSWLYPRGRWLFVFFAFLAGAQRVTAGAHYPSDVLAAAALACLIGAGLFSTSRVGRFLDRFEARA